MVDNEGPGPDDFKPDIIIDTNNNTITYNDDNDDDYYIDQKGNKKYKIKKKVDNRPPEKEIIHEKGIFDPDYIPEPPEPLTYEKDNKGNAKLTKESQKRIIEQAKIEESEYDYDKENPIKKEGNAAEIWGMGYDTPNYKPNCYKCNKDMKYAIPVYAFRNNNHWNVEILYYCPICFNNFIMAEVQNHVRKQTKKELGL